MVATRYTRLDVCMRLKQNSKGVGLAVFALAGLVGCAKTDLAQRTVEPPKVPLAGTLAAPKVEPPTAGSAETPNLPPGNGAAAKVKPGDSSQVKPPLKQPAAEPNWEKVLPKGTPKPPKGTPPDVRVVAANESGWKRSTLDGPQLAQKVDSAMRALRGVDGMAWLYVNRKGPGAGSGTLRGQIKIKDDKTYLIEYYLPSDPTYINKLVADGKRKADLELGKWSPKKPIEGALIKPAGSAADWAMRFPKLVYAGVIDGSGAWSSLLNTLQKSGGYRTVVEEKDDSVGGKLELRYRLLAQKPGSEIEAIFDGRHLVPLTIRVVQKGRSGAETQVQWTAGWNFGKPLDASLFKLP